MRFEAVGNNVIVKPNEKTSESGGIVIQPTAREKVVEGVVIKLGSGIADSNGNAVDFGISVGDRVIYEWMKGTKFTEDGEEFLVIPVDCIQAVIG